MFAFRLGFSIANCLFSVFWAWNMCKEVLEGQIACHRWLGKIITQSGGEFIWILFWNSKQLSGGRRKVFFLPSLSFLTSFYSLDFQLFWFWVTSYYSAFLEFSVCFSFTLEIVIPEHFLLSMPPNETNCEMSYADLPNFYCFIPLLFHHKRWGESTK